MIHNEPHYMAGQSAFVVFKGSPPDQPAQVMVIEDYWDRITGASWQSANGNPAALAYATRVAKTNLPLDNEAVYGKIGPYGHIVHASELGDDGIPA